MSGSKSSVAGAAAHANGRRLGVVLNRDGGTVRLLGADDLRERLTAAFASAGARAEIVLAPGAEISAELGRMRERALAGELDGVVVGGGYGSVNCAAGALAGSGVALGVLPLGTLNHFAKDVGMPADVEEAAKIIDGSEPRAVDVAEVNEAFATMAVYTRDFLGLDWAKMNPRGGAIALGHPLGTTGARQIVTGLSECRRTGTKILLTSMCIGTGMGMAGLFVNEQ